MALSTNEAEYVAACSSSCEAAWLRKLLSDLFDLQLFKNPMFHDKSKHIEIKYHYIRDKVQ